MPPKESRYPKDWLSLAEKDLVRVKRSLRDKDPELATPLRQAGHDTIPHNSFN